MSGRRDMSSATMVCSSCGAGVLLKGGEHAKWKQVQPYPDRAVLWSYCTNAPCREAFDAAVKFAKKQWGYEEEVDEA